MRNQYDEKAGLTHCLIEAVLSKRECSIQWRESKHGSQWINGWRKKRS
jgi:ribosome modulation factor